MGIIFNDLSNYFDGFTLDNFLSEEECKEYINLAEGHGFHEAKVTTPDGQIMIKEIRNNDRVIIFNEEIADRFFKKAQEFLPVIFGKKPIRCNECMRFYRYNPKQRFKWHFDGSYITPDRGEKSLISFLVYLNDDFEGGATRFANCNVKPETGSALAFMHGEKHEGGVIKSGTKYVIRTDIMYPMKYGD